MTPILAAVNMMSKPLYYIAIHPMKDLATIYVQKVKTLGANIKCIKLWVRNTITKKHHHKKTPIPDAIVNLLKPIYARLGSPSLLARCVDGYTQNANESLHSIVWKFCPKALFLGGNGVEIACALAVSMWNDGSGSLGAIAEKLQLPSTVLQKQYFHKKDKKRMSHSVYKSSERSRKLGGWQERKEKDSRIVPFKKGACHSKRGRVICLRCI